MNDFRVILLDRVKAEFEELNRIVGGVANLRIW